MATIATMFSGGEGVGVGARAAGMEHVWGIEREADIAEVARANGFGVMVGDVREVDAGRLERPDVLHASPPCPSFSPANGKRGETAEDVSLAEAVVRFLDSLRPRVFTLENVIPYRLSLSWRLIRSKLFELGYMVTVDRVNAADFGVPQTRRRMVVRAVSGGLLQPLPHREEWRGWYEAIEDLLEGLPDSDFAPWQRERLAESLPTSLVAQGGFRGSVVTRGGREPAFSITANSNQAGLKAFLVGGQFSTTAEDGGKRLSIRGEHEPAFTAMASYSGDWRAFVVNGGNSGRDLLTVRRADEPIFTVSAGSHHVPRAALATGRVVQMTPRALARFQAFPDSYVLPEGKRLACKVIGNAVPPRLYEGIVRQLEGMWER